MFIKSLINSFKYAMAGIKEAIIRERNFRIHIITIIYISTFAFLYGLERVEFAVLILTMGIVPSFELVNTAIEEITDLKSKDKNTHAKIAKDTAAAAVLIASAVSLLVAICLFGNLQKLSLVFDRIFKIPYIIIFIVSLMPSIWFIIGFKGFGKEKNNK